MSGAHARIVAQPGRFILVDLRSRNGVFRRVRNEAELLDGDEFFLGEHLFRLRSSGSITVRNPSVSGGNACSARALQAAEKLFEAVILIRSRGRRIWPCAFSRRYAGRDPSLRSG